MKTCCVFLLLFVINGCLSAKQLPLQVHVDKAGHEQEFALLARYSGDINSRLGCQAITITEDPSNIRIVWTSLKGLADHFDYIFYNGGVSTLQYDDWAGNYISIWIADSGPPPDLIRDWAAPSTCEVGYLWVYWVGYLFGLLPQYDEPGRINYGHPDCPEGYPAFGFVTSLLDELARANIKVCPK